MEITVFLRRFLWHLGSAGMLFLVCGLLAECIFPGSVLPFLDVVDGLLIFLFVVVTAVVLDV